MKNLRLTSFAALCALASAGSAQAAVLMFDFGPTTVSGASLTNSPYHSANTSFTDTEWNKIQNLDVAAGSLKWSDGATASSLTLDIGGNQSVGTKVIDLAKLSSEITSNALGSQTSAGVYAPGSVGTDGIYVGSSGARAVGFQLGGLPVGTYDIYITGRNTNTGSSQTHEFYVNTAAAGSGNFDFSALSANSLTFANGSAAITSWIVGENYVKTSFSITAVGQVLNLASYGPSRGFLNSVQIVSAVPEPSSFAMIGGAAALGLVALRRRRRA